MTSKATLLLDLELTHNLVNMRRSEMAHFVATTPYTRGGSYPKEIASHKCGLARAIIRLHGLLYSLALTNQPVRMVKISRKRTIHSAA